jgi:hypothetical protein
MRYYDILITDKDGGEFARFGTSGGTGLHIEASFPITPGASPAGEATIKIFNVPLSMFSRASDFQGKSIYIRGGMDRGLPLANPEQRGLLLQGQIFFASGTREGKACYLSFTIFAQNNPRTEPKNLTISWYKGEPIDNAIKNTMTNAGYARTETKISENTKAQRDTHACFSTIRQFSDWLKKLGIECHYKTAENNYVFTDKSQDSKSSPKEISIFDFLGQPTWLGPGLAAIKVVLRGDIQPDQYIEIKDPQLSQQAGIVNAPITQENRLGFKGVFDVVAVTHYMNYYDLAAENWCTVLQLATSEKVTA